MNLNNILTSLGGIMAQVTPVLTGAGPLVAAGKALTDAYTSIKQANNGEAPEAAEAAHRALHERVMQHADDTLGRAEGNG